MSHANEPQPAMNNELHQLQTAIENLAASVFITNEDYEIVYANLSARDMLQLIDESLASELNVQHNEIVGQYLDVFFTNPIRQGGLPESLDVLPYETDVTVGRIVLRFQLGAIENTAGERVGAIVHWSDVTAVTKLQYEQADHAANTRAVNQVLRSVEQSASQQEIMEAVIRDLQQSFGWKYGVFWTVDHAADSVRFVTDGSSLPPAFREVTASAAIRQGRGLPGRAWQQQDVVFAPGISDVAEGVRAAAAQEAGIQSGVSVPVIVSDQVVGVLEFLDTRTFKLSSDRAQTLRVIAGIVGLALHPERSDGNSPAVESAAHDVDHLTIVSRAAGEGVEDLADGSKCLYDLAMQHTASMDEALGSLQTLSSLTDRTVEQLQQLAYTTASTRASVESTVSACGNTMEHASSALAELTPAVEFIKRFEEVVFRMKLLAVNGGIEASRAGQSGQGFVIITEEMRALSREGARIADDALEALHAVRRELQPVINQSKVGRSEVESAAREMTGIESTLETALNDAQAQASSLDQLIRDVSEFDRILRENAENAEDFAAAAEETAYQLASLHRFVEDASSGKREIEHLSLTATE